MKTQRLSFILAAVLAVVACDNANGPAERAASISVNPRSATLEIGESRSLQAVIKTAEGKVLHGRPVSWSSGAEMVATVSPAGVVTAVGAGTAVITATSESRSATATLRVEQPPVHEVVFLHQSPLILDEGGSMQLIAVAKDARGEVVPNVIPVWTSSNDEVVWLSNSGGIVARNAGTAQIEAAVEGKTATLTIEVRTLVRSVEIDPSNSDVAIGGTTRLTATALDAAGRPLGRTITWVSLNPDIATVDATGKVTTHRTGTAWISASVAGVEGRATVQVGEVRNYLLSGAEGRPIPAFLYSTEFVDDDGVLRTASVYARGGMIRTLNDKYQQSLITEWYVEGTYVWTNEVVDRGHYLYNMMTYEMMFYSDLYPGLEFTGMPNVDGSALTVTQRVDGEQPPFTFVYRKQ